ncbi:hypothetical protein [Deinococcus irradiatisoli]|uniref:hypothetical protein n=1 Tax=Deinococcus irradiatisoli TaxID=2202254 RepID=UPI0011B28020|nr:hypothetical protein [Deinococcus irradiatisoli]
MTDAAGQPTERDLSAREAWLVLQADAALKAAQALIPGAALRRLNINGMLPDTRPGYLYLRYQPAGDLSAAPQEFWACFRRHASFDRERGLLGVPAALAPS